VRKTPLFLSNVYINASFYQDRLGTNIGKALKKEWRFSHQAVELENQKKEEEGIDKLQVRTYCPGLTDAMRYDAVYTAVAYDDDDHAIPWLLRVD
jgi:hypothetical protein